MTTSFIPPKPEVPREAKFGRPLVIPPGGGKPVPYTRCTTYVGAVEDTWALSRWQQRMVALGLAERKDLLLSVAAHREDKGMLDQLCESAAEAAKARAGATIGTALHSLTEQMDRGLDVGTVPPEYAPDLAAYADATKDLTAVHIEEFTVLDRLKIGGTPDRVVRYQGKRFIADLKTGAIEWGFVKIAAQLAVYARSSLYDPETGARTPHGAELDKGIVIHLPAGTGECRLYWIDLLTGWDAVRIARDVREKRGMKFAQVMTAFGNVVEPVSITEPSLDLGPNTGTPVTDSFSLTPTLAEQIVASTTREQVTALWAQHASEWTPDLTEIAKQHLASL